MLDQLAPKMSNVKDRVRVKWNFKWYTATIDRYFPDENKYDVVFDLDQYVGKVSAKNVKCLKPVSHKSLSFKRKVNSTENGSAVRSSLVDVVNEPPFKKAKTDNN